MPSARPYLIRTADGGQSYTLRKVLCQKLKGPFSKVRPACCTITSGVNVISLNDPRGIETIELHKVALACAAILG